MSDESLETILVPPGDYWPHKQLRQIGRLHLCLMCKCGTHVQFLSLEKEKMNKVFAKCDGTLTFTCPGCDEHQSRSFPEFIQVVYSDGVEIENSADTDHRDT